MSMIPLKTFSSWTDRKGNEFSDLAEMNYFYGQAPSTSTSLPFTFHPMSHGSASLGKASAPQPGMPSVGFPSSHSQQPSSIGIRPASEVYASAAWNLKPGTSVGGSHSFHSASHTQADHPTYESNPVYTQNLSRSKGGGKGGRWVGKGFGSTRENANMPVGKAANAIPLGKQRVFASAPEATEENQSERHRERSPAHRPMRVVGRGRALTTPAWAKEAEKAPGDDRYRVEESRDRFPRQDDRRPSNEERIGSRFDNGPRRHEERPTSSRYDERSPIRPNDRRHGDERSARFDEQDRPSRYEERPTRPEDRHERSSRTYGDDYQSRSNSTRYDDRRTRRVSRSRSPPSRRSRRPSLERRR